MKDNLMTAQEAAAYTGYVVGQIYNLKCQGKLPAYKAPGKKGAVRFRREDLDKLFLRIGA